MKSFSIACLMAAAAVAAPTGDLVKNLPDVADFESPTYSGYLDVSETKHLHYMFTESLESPSTDPIVIWFNGGPGCSSMLGFMQENGPYVIEDGATEITKNPEPWNKRANVIWLESPAGVGYSVTDNDQGLHTNDMISSSDALKAL
jgi:cathepsin A (carboxypeptidase C)